MSERLRLILALLLLSISAPVFAENFTSETLKLSSDTQSLFNGIDLSGWHEVKYEQNASSPSLWSFKDGVLACKEKGTGYIRTDQPHGDYVLRLEWRWPETPGNSGVMLHVQPPDKVWPMGFKAQLFRRRAGDVLLVGDVNCTEKLEPRIEKASEYHIPMLIRPSEKQQGEWNALQITCAGDTIEIKVNDVLQNRLTACNPARGSIALRAENSAIEFRNVSLEKLKP